MTWQVEQGDCVERMAALPAASIDAVVCDPPYSLEFMGNAWDSHGAPTDAAFGYWLAGFVDGEGCFRVQRHTRGTHTCTFTIKVRRDERGTLERIARFLGCGTVRDVAAEGNAQPTVRLAVQDKEGCQRVVETFVRYPLRAKKARDFWGWAEAVAEWSTKERGNRWTGPSDQSRMAALKERIESGREFEEPVWTGHPFQDWSREWAQAAFRVLKPGGHLLAFGGTRTYHRLACAVEDAGFEIRDSITWLYGSGFPKSLNVSKAIDKAAGAEREVVGQRTDGRYANEFSERAKLALGGDNADEQGMSGEMGQITRPATPEAATWEGWGTGLKPAFEPIVVARKPLEGTVSQNVLEHGTGALNIDGCKLPVDPDDPVNEATFHNKPNVIYGEYADKRDGVQTPMRPEGGRWPANVALSHTEDCVPVGTRKVRTGVAVRRNLQDGGDYNASAYMIPDQQGPDVTFAHEGTWETITDWNCAPGCPVAALDEQSGELHSQDPATRRSGSRVRGATGFGTGSESAYGDLGGASRFFYTAKASPGERHAGLEGFEAEFSLMMGNGIGEKEHDPETATPKLNVHPTVKPIELMRWLCRLVTPPYGTVLDPFTGSGTTGIAAVLDGFDFLGIEREPGYVEIAEARITFWEQHIGREVGDLLRVKASSDREKQQATEAGQLGLDFG